MLNRLVIDETRLTNRSMCGSDTTPFCVPITRPYDNVFYIDTNGTEDFNLSSVNVYDNDGNLILVLTDSTLYHFFNYVKALDSDGNYYFLLQQKAPIYNYAGVTPEVTCYSMQITLISDPGGVSTTYYSEPVCYIDTYTMKHYVIAASDADTNNAEYTIMCEGETIASVYLYNNLPPGWFLEYGTGPFIDLYIPEDCTLTDVKIGSQHPNFQYVLVEFGYNSCPTYVTLTGSGIFNYDCKGRFYTDTFEQPSGEEYAFNVTNLPNYINDYRIHLMGTMAQQLANVVTPKRVSPSCYIPSNEVVSRYKISGNCRVPAWYVEEVNIIAASQSVLVEGTNPIADDYNVLISLVQSDEYAWKPQQQNNMFFPVLFFETCVCYVNFVC